MSRLGLLKVRPLLPGVAAACSNNLGAGRGLFALRDCPVSRPEICVAGNTLILPSSFQRGTTLFKVPSTALMNRTTVSKLYPGLRKRKLSGIQLVSLHLLLHKPSGDNDSLDPVFGPYISTLPRDFSSHPLTWMVKRTLKREDDWERRTLEYLPSSVIGKLTALYKRFWDDWEVISGVLVRCSSCAS